MSVARVVVLAVVTFAFSACGGSSDSSSHTSNGSVSDQSQRSVAASNLSAIAPASTVSLTNAAPINPESFPFVKQLRLTFESGPSFSFGGCTATFINSHVLLTAAHCLYDLNTMTPLEAAGVEIEMERGRFVPAAAVLPHPEFNGHFNYSAVYADTAVAAADIGVVISSEEFDGAVPAIAVLPPAVGETVALVGFGQSAAASVFSGGILRLGYTTVDAVSLSERVLYWIQDQPNEASTCHGDSGGPAFQISLDNQLILAGITSSGDPDCRPYYPAVDTLVASFADWIVAATGGDVQL